MEVKKWRVADITGNMPTRKIYAVDVFGAARRFLFESCGDGFHDETNANDVDVQVMNLETEVACNMTTNCFNHGLCFTAKRKK